MDIGMWTQLDLDPIFEKILTQTDMRKRCLLVPKRYAKKYFDPVVGGDITNDFSPILSFEDESGQIWQFDYKFWKSDKSYVLNGRGWNRYVSYMSLATGDVVSFKRQRRDTSRFFIFSRRPSPTPSYPEAIAVPILTGYFPCDRNQITFEWNSQLHGSHWERLATNDATSGFSCSCQASTSQLDSENSAMLHSPGLDQTFPATFSGNNNITNDVHQMGMFNNVNTHQALEEFNTSDQGNYDIHMFGQDSTFLNSNIDMDAELFNDEWVNSLLTAYSPSTMPISDVASLGHKIMEHPNNDMVVQADHGLANSFNPADDHYINHFKDYQRYDPELMAPQLESFGDHNELVNNMMYPHDSMCENCHEHSSIFRS